MYLQKLLLVALLLWPVAALAQTEEMPVLYRDGEPVQPGWSTLRTASSAPRVSSAAQRLAEPSSSSAPTAATRPPPTQTSSVAVAAATEEPTRPAAPAEPLASENSLVRSTAWRISLNTTTSLILSSIALLLGGGIFWISRRGLGFGLGSTSGLDAPPPPVEESRANDIINQATGRDQL